VVTPPRKVWVWTYEFPLHFVLPDDPVLVVRGKPSDGVTGTHEEERGIWIAASLDDRKTLEIVWHELTHAIDWAYGIDRGSSEERIARQHGIAWSQFFLDNPKFVRWYMGIVRRVTAERKAA
jgi:hypothetical protein